MRLVDLLKYTLLLPLLVASSSFSAAQERFCIVVVNDNNYHIAVPADMRLEDLEGLVKKRKEFGQGELVFKREGSNGDLLAIATYLYKNPVNEVNNITVFTEEELKDKRVEWIVKEGDDGYVLAQYKKEEQLFCEVKLSPNGKNGKKTAYKVAVPFGMTVKELKRLIEAKEGKSRLLLEVKLQDGQGWGNRADGELFSGDNVLTCAWGELSEDIEWIVTGQGDKYDLVPLKQGPPPVPVNPSLEKGNSAEKKEFCLVDLELHTIWVHSWFWDTLCRRHSAVLKYSIRVDAEITGQELVDLVKRSWLPGKYRNTWGVKLSSIKGWNGSDSDKVLTEGDYSKELVSLLGETEKGLLFAKDKWNVKAGMRASGVWWIVEKDAKGVWRLESDNKNVDPVGEVAKEDKVAGCLPWGGKLVVATISLMGAAGAFWVVRWGYNVYKKKIATKRRGAGRKRLGRKTAIAFVPDEEAV